MDVPGAYLNTVLPEEDRIPMKLGPEEVNVLLSIKPEWAPYRRSDGTMIVILQGGLYGLPQAAKLWNDMIVKSLKSIGYLPTSTDPCCFIKRDSLGRRSVIILYVDDLCHFYQDQDFQKVLLGSLSDSYGALTCNDGDIGKFIGIEYNYDRSDRSVRLTMDQYVDKLLLDFNIQKGSETPTSLDFMTVDESSPRVDSKKFASGVMSIFYLALRVRKDILLAITVLSTRISDARQHDVKKLDKLFRFIFHTRKRGIVLRTRGTRVHLSIDASFAIHPNGRSHSGVHLTLGGDEHNEDGYGGPIHCISVSQKPVALSSHEAELYAFKAAIPVMFDPVQLMKDLFFRQDDPAIIFEDNMALIDVLNNGRKYSSRTRHINVSYYFAQSLIEQKIIVIVYRCTIKMLADMLTKHFSSRASMSSLQLLCNDIY